MDRYGMGLAQGLLFGGVLGFLATVMALTLAVERAETRTPDCPSETALVSAEGER